jgi:competence ComEA-like helix-hairpin-helix protein
MLRVCLLLLAVVSVAWPAWADKGQLEGVVNLNMASPDELGLIPGVGPARVRNILAYRKAHAFRTVDELARIKGIGRKTIRRWRTHLAVSGPSTAQKVVRPQAPEVPLAELAQKPSRPVLVVHPPPPILPIGRPLLRKGEPAHAYFPQPSGNNCLPPR